MLNVGLSGGIASGKSIVCKIFEMMGVPLYYTDLHAKRIMNESIIVRSKLVDTFGAESYVNDGINVQYLSLIVFNSEEKRKTLNSIVHPEVWKDQQKWLKNVSDYSYVVTESALIFETGFYKEFDYTINVTAPIPDRIEWLMQRNKISRSEAITKIEAQADDVFRNNLADFVINNYKYSSIIEQVIELDNYFKNNKCKFTPES